MTWKWTFSSRHFAKISSIFRCFCLLFIHLMTRACTYYEIWDPLFEKICCFRIMKKKRFVIYQTVTRFQIEWITNTNLFQNAWRGGDWKWFFFSIVQIVLLSFPWFAYSIKKQNSGLPTFKNDKLFIQENCIQKGWQHCKKVIVVKWNFKMLWEKCLLCMLKLNYLVN